MPDDIVKIMADELRKKVHDELRKIGFTYVSLDLYGYRAGNMNVFQEENE